jgi:hypothetical protein
MEPVFTSWGALVPLRVSLVLIIAATPTVLTIQPLEKPLLVYEQAFLAHSHYGFLQAVSLTMKQ